MLLKSHETQQILTTLPPLIKPGHSVSIISIFRAAVQSWCFCFPHEKDTCWRNKITCPRSIHVMRGWTRISTLDYVTPRFTLLTLLTLRPTGTGTKILKFSRWMPSPFPAGPPAATDTVQATWKELGANPLLSQDLNTSLTALFIWVGYIVWLHNFLISPRDTALPSRFHF